MTDLDRIIAELQEWATEQYRAGYAEGVKDVKASPYYDDSADTKPAALAGAAPVDWVVRCRRTGRVVWSDPSRSTAEGYARTIAHRMPDNTLDTEVIPLFTHASAKAREELSDAECDAIYEALDRWAKSLSWQDYALPGHPDDKSSGPEIIRAALATFADGEK